MKNLNDMKRPDSVTESRDQNGFDFNFGLSDQEKNDLESLITKFQYERDQRKARQCPAEGLAEIQSQINTINNRLEYLTNLMLKMDRRMKPMYESIRLNCQKSEILDQRIRILIESIRTGELL